MIKHQLSQHFCRAIWFSCLVGVTLCYDFYTFRSCNTCTFSLPTFAVLRHATYFLVSSGKLLNNYSMKQADLYYFETMQMTSQAWSKFTENTCLPFVFSIQNLTRLVTSFLWFQNSIDQAVSWNKCQFEVFWPVLHESDNNVRYLHSGFSTAPCNNNSCAISVSVFIRATSKGVKLSEFKLQTDNRIKADKKLHPES